MSKTTKITPLVKLSEQFLRGELTGEDFHAQLLGCIEDAVNDDDADLAMEQLAAQLVKV